MHTFQLTLGTAIRVSNNSLICLLTLSAQDSSPFSPLPTLLNSNIIERRKISILSQVSLLRSAFFSLLLISPRRLTDFRNFPSLNIFFQPDLVSVNVPDGFLLFSTLQQCQSVTVLTRPTSPASSQENMICDHNFLLQKQEKR